MTNVFFPFCFFQGFKIIKNLLSCISNFSVTSNRIIFLHVPHCNLITFAGENGRITYSIIRGNVFGAFEIGRSSGKIFTAREVDYELSPSYMLRIRAVDSSSLKPRSNLLVVNVIVIDINDSAPKFTTDSCLFSIPENIALGSPVWNFSASDADSGSYGQVQYEIPYQFPQHGFRIHPTTGVLSVADEIDHERFAEYTLVVTAADRDPVKSNRKSASLKCQIVIQDENDHAPKFVSRNLIRLSEEVQIGSPITQMVALDEDSNGNGNVSYEIARGNEDRVFLLDSATGEISGSFGRSKYCRINFFIQMIEILLFICS